MYDQLHFLIKETAFLLDEGERKLLEPLNLSMSRFHLLNHLYLTPGIVPSALSEKMMCHRSNITRMVRKLEKEGLLTRLYDDSDHRVIRLVLTPKGERLIGQARQQFEGHVEDRLSLLQIEKRHQLIQHLKAFSELLAR